MSVKVKLPDGRIGWLQDVSSLDQASGQSLAIAPLHHCDDKGLLDPFLINSLSLAHLYEDGQVLEYGVRIAFLEDLELA